MTARWSTPNRAARRRGTNFRAHGLAADRRLVASFAGRPGRSVLAEIPHRFGADHTVDDLFEEAMSYATAAAEPVRGAVELVRAMDAHGVPVGVVTSGTRDYAQAELDALGVSALLSVLVTAEDVTNGKPDPEGYRTGCRALEVAPGRTVVFEDAPAGIAAAKAAGAFCLAVTTSQPAAALAAAGLVVADLAEARVKLGLCASTPGPNGRISLGLLEVPENRADDRRARIYIVDHVNPGVTFSRRMLVTSTSRKPVHVELYAGAAKIKDGEFEAAPGRKQNELSSWITLSRSSVNLPPRGTAVVRPRSPSRPGQAGANAKPRSGRRSPPRRRMRREGSRSSTESATAPTSTWGRW